jgi:imidazolonepropionase
MDLFLANIAQLVTVAARGAPVKSGPEMRNLSVLTEAGVLCRGGKIAWVGRMSDFDPQQAEGIPEFDGRGKLVLPGFVDSHTHAMFAGNRVSEFARRAEGASYQQIAQEGGGILSTVREVRAASKRALKRSTAAWLAEMLRYGTTTVEIKSGYGLTMDSEIKMLEAIQELKNEELIGVVPTFLGAHAVPQEFHGRAEAYVALLREQIIPYIGGKKMAAFCDVFCEAGYFSPEDAESLLLEGKRWGLSPKVHADELSGSGGAELAARVKAVSADHLENVSERGITALAEAGVVAGLLPGVSFYLNHGYAPARELIDAGVPVALASDFNPGSCLAFSMPLMMTIACTQMRMSPEEALTAATLNGAAALGLSATLGSIEVGKQADLIVADVPDYRFLAAYAGRNPVRTTIKNGTLLEL